MSEIDLSALSQEQRERWRVRLNHLPPGIRASLLKSLSKVPPERVAKILADNEPMLARLEQKLQGSVATAASAKARLPERIQLFGTKGHTTTGPCSAATATACGWCRSSRWRSSSRWR